MDFEKAYREVIEDSFDELSEEDAPCPFMPYKRKLLEKLPTVLKAAYIAGMEDVVEEYCDSEVSDFLASILQRIKELKGSK